VLKKLQPAQNLATAGCGVGFFAQILAEAGLNVCGFDGRAENVAEARRRYPEIPFEQADVQDRRILELGQFDLVLCFGLLCHLENPMLAIRHLRALAGKFLLVESMCLPDDQSATRKGLPQALTERHAEGPLPTRGGSSSFALTTPKSPLARHIPRWSYKIDSVLPPGSEQRFGMTP
jgi:SAM-dependent methyltransferase